MDRIGDFCTRIRNAVMARHSKVDIPYSKIQLGMAELLKEHGYIRDCRTARSGDFGLIRVYLKYKTQRKPALNFLQRVSKPSRRIYAKVDRIPEVCSGYGMIILSTNKGVLDGKKAKEMNVGGELLCEVR